MKHAKTLNKDEIRRVLAVIEASQHAGRNRIAFLLSLYAGLRVNEIAQLTIRDVYNSMEVNRFIVMDASRMKQKRSHTIILNKKLVAALTSYRASLDMGKPDSPLIPSQKGKAFSANTLCQLFARIYQQAGLPNCSSHSGRRTFITELAHKGVSAKVIMQLSGHTHLSTTQKYIDVNDTMLVNAVELL